MTKKYIITCGKNLAWQMITYIGKAVLFFKLEIKDSGTSALYYITYIYTCTCITDLVLNITKLNVLFNKNF